MKKIILLAAFGLTLVGSLSSCSSTRYTHISKMRFTDK
jgi:hypothetical protein